MQDSEENLGAMVGDEMEESSEFDEYTEEVVTEQVQVVPPAIETTPGSQVLDFETNEKFSKFLLIMSKLADICTDLPIMGGKICQMSNRRNAFYCIDVMGVVGATDIILSNIKPKVALLDSFRSQQTRVILEISQNDYVFKDTYSKFKFSKPLEQYLSNQYISENDLQDKLQIEGQGPIFEHSMGKFLIDRINSISKALSASLLRIEFEGNTANFNIVTGDNTSATVATIVSIPIDREVRGISVFPVDAFRLGTAGDTQLSCFFRGTDMSQTLLKIVSTTEDIPIEIWCLSKLVTGDEAEIGQE